MLPLTKDNKYPVKRPVLCHDVRVVRHQDDLADLLLALEISRQPIVDRSVVRVVLRLVEGDGMLMGRRAHRERVEGETGERSFASHGAEIPATRSKKSA